MATLTVRSGSDGFDHIREIPANWWFERTGATGRERSRTNRTQEVAVTEACEGAVLSQV